MTTPKTPPPSHEEALHRVKRQAAISLADLAVLMDVHVSTVQKWANRDDLPVPVARLGQRWIVPSAPVRELLHIAADSVEAA